jgi:hypothetical protein
MATKKSTPSKKKKGVKEPKKKISKLEKAASRIVDVGDNFEYLKILVYGKPKRGKTTFGASGPKPIIIDCNEKGTLSIRNFEDVKVFSVETWTDIDLAYWYLKKGDHDRETVVIDTVTTLAQLCMKFVLGDEVSRDPTRDPSMPSKQAWGKVAELMRTEILQFRNLPMNVVFLAQERRGFTDDDDEAPEVFPEISPSVRSALTPAVDIIGRLYVKEVVEKGGEEDGKKKGQKKKGKRVMERRMLIGADEVYTTGDRSESGLPEVIKLTDPKNSLSDLIDHIRGYGKEE